MKKSKQCTYSLGQEEESLQTSLWDTDPSLRSSGTTMQQESLEPDQKTDGLTDSKCGMEMLENLTHMTTKDEWIAFMRDSLAKTFQSQAVRQALSKAHGLDFTEKSYALRTRYDLDTCSWKTSQTSLVEMMDECSEQSLETLPSAALMRSGLVYPLPKLGPITNEIGGGFWATPRANSAMSANLTENMASHPHPNLEVQMARQIWPTPDANCGARGTQPNWTPKRKSGQPAQYTINQAVRDKPWPTPTAHMAKETNAPIEANRNQPTMASMVGGALNPPWVEWLMGWPIGHTDSER